MHHFESRTFMPGVVDYGNIFSPQNNYRTPSRYPNPDLSNSNSNTPNYIAGSVSLPVSPHPTALSDRHSHPFEDAWNLNVFSDRENKEYRPNSITDIRHQPSPVHHNQQASYKIQTCTNHHNPQFKPYQNQIINNTTSAMYHSQGQNFAHGSPSFTNPGHSYLGQGYMHRNMGTPSLDTNLTSSYTSTKPYRSFSSELNSPDLPLPEEIDMDFDFPVISSFEETGFDNPNAFNNQNATYSNSNNNQTYNNTNGPNGGNGNINSNMPLLYPKLESSDKDSPESCNAPFSNGYSQSSRLDDKLLRNKEDNLYFHYASYPGTGPASPNPKYSSSSNLVNQPQIKLQQRPSSYPQFSMTDTTDHAHNGNLHMSNGAKQTSALHNQSTGHFTHPSNPFSFLSNDDLKGNSHDFSSQLPDLATSDRKPWSEFASPLYQGPASEASPMGREGTTGPYGSPSSLADFVKTNEDFFTDLGVSNHNNSEHQNGSNNNSKESTEDDDFSSEGVSQLLSSNPRKRSSNGFGKRALERIIHQDSDSKEPQTEFITNAVISSAMDHILKNRPSSSSFPTAREIFDSSYKKLKAVLIKDSPENGEEKGSDDSSLGGDSSDTMSMRMESTEGNLSASASNSSSPSPSTTMTLTQLDPGTPLGNDMTSQSPPANENGNQSTVSSSSKPDKRRPSVLPPCRVCNSKASGLHYGVVTCEACNGFFRRSLKRGAIYLCSKDKKCDVRGKKRGECSYCRYQRCLSVGMSKSAVKTGRYSDKTRLAYAIETENQSKASLIVDDLSHLDIMTSDIVKFHDQHVLTSTRVPDFEMFQRQFKYYQVYCSEASSVSSCTRVMSLYKNILPELPVRLLPEDTGEVGFSKVIAGFLENWLRHYVKFVKNIPGFNLLHINDQATLVRATWHEIWLLGSYKGFNLEMQVTANPNGTVLHYNEIKMIFGKVYANLSYRLSSRLQKLNVTPEETILIKMMCMTYPDRHRLEQPEQVRSLHWLMTQCLMRELEKNHTDEPNAFSEIVSTLVELRAVLHEALLPSNGYKYKHPLNHETPLLKEIMAYTPS